MAINNLNDLFVHTLKDILYAERSILKALPKMENKATSEQLKEAFKDHHEVTEKQIERLEEVFDLIGKPARGVQCDAIRGIIEEAEDVMSDIKDPETLDAGLIACAQAVEHYEIARYGTLVEWAKQLDLKDAAAKLDETLQEEKSTDVALSKLALQKVNQKAAA